MNKPMISNPAFADNENSNIAGFNFVSKVNTFTSIFDPKPLERQEEVDIHNLLLQNSPSDHEDLTDDMKQIKALTIEIKAIQKQSLVLTGERLDRVRTILRRYREGTFTQWLKTLFKSKQTGYNILAYYEFYSLLPSKELKETFQKLPQKIAYMLASRDGDLQIKVDLLKDQALNQTGTDPLPLIRERLPLSLSDKRKTRGEELLLIESMLRSAHVLYKRKTKLSEELIDQLKEVYELIEKIIG